MLLSAGKIIFHCLLVSWYGFAECYHDLHHIFVHSSFSIIQKQAIEYVPLNS